MQEFADFLGKHPPYDRLDAADLARLGRHLLVEFFPAGASILTPQARPLEHLAVIRTGIVHVLDRGAVVDELGPGDTFGQFSVFSGLPPTFTARAATDTLLYLMPDPREILDHPDTLRFGATWTTPVRSALLASTVVDSTLRPVTDYASPPVWCDARVTIREAARVMTAARASCVLIRQGRDVGIMTDSDCRRLVATGAYSIHAPLSRIASSPALTIRSDATAASAFLTMVHRGVHHLVVVDHSGEPVGVCRAIDLAAAEIRDPLTIRSAIESATDLGALAEAASQLRPTAIALRDAGVPPLRIGALLSAMVEAVLEKCIGWTVPFAGDEGTFAWFVLGSLARREPLPDSDVDTALLWADDAVVGPERIRAGAESVLSDVERCGLARCPDGANATSPLFSRPCAEWLARAHRWREDPATEGAQLLGALKADSRPVTGVVLGRRLDEEILHLPDDESFARRSLAEALTHKPPIGFVKEFIVDHEGQHRGQLDLKRGGLVPIVGIGRWIALKTRSTVTSTQDRIQIGRAAGLLNHDEAAQLAYAHQHMYELLFDAEIEALRVGTPTSTWMDPRHVDSLRRRHLRQSFKAIAAVQERLEAEWLGPR